MLLDSQVDFVVIGGIACLVHGSPFPTEDLDITPDRSAANLARLAHALDQLGAGANAGDGGLPEAATMRRLVTLHGHLDISLVPSGTAGYDDRRPTLLPSRYSG